MASLPEGLMLKRLPGVPSVVALATMIVLLTFQAPAQHAPATQLVILVRHAEKASCTDRDSVLSKRGRIRAEALAGALQDTAVKRIVTTEFKRTQETAGPLAQKFGIAPLTIAREKNPNHVQHVVEAVVSQRPDTVVVVAHSDSVPEIIKELRGPTLSDLPANRYSALFVATLGADATQLVRARYGDVDPKAECE
jgi:phosphohistidine phosphatase SixA